jgi:hypothetical protein
VTGQQVEAAARRGCRRAQRRPLEQGAQAEEAGCCWQGTDPCSTVADAGGGGGEALASGAS